MKPNYSFEKVKINGHDYVNIGSDLFHAYFNVFVDKNPDEINKELINLINKMWSKAIYTKKKRIKLKREKYLLLLMYGIMEKVMIRQGKLEGGK